MAREEAQVNGSWVTRKDPAQCKSSACDPHKSHGARGPVADTPENWLVKALGILSKSASMIRSVMEIGNMMNHLTEFMFSRFRRLELVFPSNDRNRLYFRAPYCEA